jgi:glycosyltransferase involved in cell wall biosynthesis
MHVAGEPLTLGMVALFRPRKGVEVLLEALALLRASGAPVRLHAVGPFETPEYEQDVLELVRRLALQETVTWTGFRSDIAAEFRHMHVFVLPSLFGEGMPMVVLEAMAAGLPVVATRIEGVPQVVRHGQDGLLVEPNDPAALADTLLQFARNEAGAEALGDSGWKRQREHFSDVSMAERVAAVYQEVLES